MSVNYIDFQSADITMRHRTQNHHCAPSHYYNQNTTLSNSHDIICMNDHKSSKLSTPGEKSAYISLCTVATLTRNQTDTTKNKIDHSGKIPPYCQNIKNNEDHFFYSYFNGNKCTDNVNYDERGIYCINGHNKTGNSGNNDNTKPLIYSNSSLNGKFDFLKLSNCEKYDNLVHYDRRKSSSKSQHSHSQRSIHVLGVNITYMNRKAQFLFCATGVFLFSLLYGILQELISVSIFNRKLGLFQALMQFVGYTSWSYYFRRIIVRNQSTSNLNIIYSHKALNVPFKWYIILSLFRALDLSMTNMAMAYINYPAKTIIKSSRVVFTMLFGAVIQRKKYQFVDYMVVLLMVLGLFLFIHAEVINSVVFHPLGIIMLTISLLCDGAISNMSESIMRQYDIEQDEFIFWLYSIATVVIMFATSLSGDFINGILFLLQPGTLDEISNEDGKVIVSDTTTSWTFKTSSSSSKSWSITGKIFILISFITMGFYGSSCSAAITKHFGALTMSITSTARKALTLFFSFIYFGNICTLEHAFGTLLFMVSLIAKTITANKRHDGTFDNDKNRLYQNGYCFVNKHNTNDVRCLRNVVDYNHNKDIDTKTRSNHLSLINIV